MRWHRVEQIVFGLLHPASLHAEIPPAGKDQSVLVDSSFVKPFLVPKSHVGKHKRGVFVGRSADVTDKEKFHVPTRKTTPSDFRRLVKQDLHLPSPLPDQLVFVPPPKRHKPIAVLDRLKYSGNIGTIIRTAVQLGVFEAVYIISSKPNEDIMSMKDLVHFSVRSALLIEVKQFPNVAAFLKARDTTRKFVNVDLTPGAHGIHGPTARAMLSDPMTYVVVGNEGLGISKELLELSDMDVFIPVRFKSINVASAFAIVASKLLELGHAA